MVLMKKDDIKKELNGNSPDHADMMAMLFGLDYGSVFDVSIQSKTPVRKRIGVFN